MGKVRCRFTVCRWNRSYENRNAVCWSECKETRSTSPLKLFEELEGRLVYVGGSITRRSLWVCHFRVSCSAICCPQRAPYCGNYCFDYCTSLIYSEWNKIMECIHSPATRMQAYYYKRLESTQKSLTTYVVNSKNVTLVLLSHHSLWQKIIGIKVYFPGNENEQGSFLNGSSNSSGLQDLSSPFRVNN